MAADKTDRVKRWLMGVKKNGVYNHGDVFSVLFKSGSVFSLQCTGVTHSAGDACHACKSMWACTRKVPGKDQHARDGSTKPPFYCHVTGVLRRYTVDCSWGHLYGSERVAYARMYMRLNNDRNNNDGNLIMASNPELQTAVATLSTRYALYSPEERAAIMDMLFNGGRHTVSSKKGRRWAHNRAKHVALKLGVRVGYKILKELPGVILPSKNTVKCDIQRFLHFGLQEAQVQNAVKKLVGDVCISADELAVNQRYSTQFVNGAHILVGNADALPSVRYPNARVIQITSADSLPDVSTLPVATQALIWIAHNHVHGSPVYPVWVQPTDGSLVIQDYMLMLNAIEKSMVENHKSIYGDGGAVLAWNVAFDNHPIQAGVKLGVIKPFTADEDKVIKEKGLMLVSWAAYEDGRGWYPCSDWQEQELLQLCVELERPLGILMHRVCFLKNDIADACTDLDIPYPGMLWKAHVSYHTRTPCGVSPEAPHLARLLVKHLRDKRSRMIIWSFIPCSGPMLLSDLITHYYTGNAAGIRYVAIDQSDSTQSNARASDVCNINTARCIANQFGCASTSIACLVGGCFLSIFREGGKKGETVSLRCKLVYASFVLTALVSQRVKVFKTAGLKLACNSYTSQTMQAMVTDLAGFILVVRKGASLFGTHPVVPSCMGEQRNETLNGWLRNPNGTMSGDVSMGDVMRRLGEVTTLTGYESALGARDRVGDGAGDSGVVSGRYQVNGSACYRSDMTLKDIQVCLAIGEEMWRSVGDAHGYGDLSGPFKSIYKHFLTISKPTYYKTLRTMVANHNPPQLWDEEYKVHMLACLEPELRSMNDAVKAVIACASAAAHSVSVNWLQCDDSGNRMDASTSAPVVSAAVANDQRVAAAMMPSAEGPIHIHTLLAFKLNDECSKQSRELRNRYATMGYLRGDNRLLKRGGRGRVMMIWFL